MVTRNNSSAQEHLLLEFLEVAARVERKLDRGLSVIRGVSFSEYRLLRALAAQHALSSTRVDLASAVGLTPSAVTRALKPLEKLHYVKTEKSARDARQSLATLTPSGQELLSDTQGILTDIMRSMPIEELSATGVSAFAAKIR
ncbi:MAG: MarR family winged helix-turn-helix transcriptional regulator [Pseudomonadales bacterium]